MTDVIAEIAAFDGRIAKITGPVRSGKTEALVRRAAALLSAGVAPDAILLATSTAEAARVARHRLAEALAAAGASDAAALAARTNVTCARAVCLAVLDTPEARAATGRTPRVRLALDGRSTEIDMGTEIRLVKAPFSVLLLQPAAYTFADGLREKLHWGAE